MKYSVEWDRWENKQYHVWVWGKTGLTITDGWEPRYPTLEEALQRLRELLKK